MACQSSKTTRGFSSLCPHSGAINSINRWANALSVRLIAAGSTLAILILHLSGNLDIWHLYLAALYVSCAIAMFCIGLVGFKLP
ncbi:hypothetical protein IQ255_15550 [Pleurocapsales cyanobacterium LEGE 10410]|nr:hypothetical protein [Pleurocapsales cyanobacterium LEGE 10410]